LLIFDVLLLVADLGLEGLFHESENHFIHSFEHTLKMISIGILWVFAIEVVLLLIAFDLAFFLHPLYIMDAVIVGVALFIELYLQDVLVASLLIVLRLWRVVRVVHGIIMVGQNAHRKTKEELEHLRSEFAE